MRAVMLLLVTVLAGCGTNPQPMPHRPGAPMAGETPEQQRARLDAAQEARLRFALERERQQERLAQVFGMEWRMTRIAMDCDDPTIRRVAYATAAQQERYFDRMARNRPTLAQISAHEDTRAARRTAGIRPSAAECQRLLTVMGESAKGMRDGER
jgi:hypothetical protein